MENIIPVNITNEKDKGAAALLSLYNSRAEKAMKSILGYLARFRAGKYTGSQIYTADINARRAFRTLYDNVNLLSAYWIGETSPIKWLTDISEALDEAIENSVIK